MKIVMCRFLIPVTLTLLVNQVARATPKSQAQFKSKATIASASTVEGTIEMEIYDNPLTKRSLTKTFLREATTGKKIELRDSLRLRKANLQAGQRVKLRGTRDPKSISVAAPGTVSNNTNTSSTDTSTAETMVLEMVLATTTIQTNVATASSPTNITSPNAAWASGEQKSLVYLVSFTDTAGTETMTPTEARNILYGRISGFFQRVSYGKTWFTGEATAWITVPMLSSEFNSRNSEALTYIKNAAVAQGFDTSIYRRHIYVLNGASNGWAAGVANVGANPSWTNIFGVRHYRDDFGVIEHELGHNLGLLHAHSFNCGRKSFGACRFFEYGDTIDIMSSGSQDRVARGSLGSYHREQMGWLNAPGTPVSQDVTASGDYLIENLDSTPTSAPKALRVLKSYLPNTGLRYWYYIDRAAGYGISIRLAREGVTTYNPSQSEVYVDPVTFRGPLNVGESLVDEDSGLAFIYASDTGAGANVRILFNKKKPQVTPTGSLIKGAPGSTVALSVSISNTDSPITKVEFVRTTDNLVLCSLMAAPFSCSWTVPNDISGAHFIRATAWDQAGISSSADFSVSPDYAKPTSLISVYNPPASVGPGTSLQILHTGTDERAVGVMRLLFNGSPICKFDLGPTSTPAFSSTCNWTVPNYLTNATYRLTGEVVDQGGNISTPSTLDIVVGAGGTPQLQPPVVNLKSPVDGSTILPFDVVYPNFDILTPQGVDVYTNNRLFIDNEEICSGGMGLYGCQVFFTYPLGRALNYAIEGFDTSGLRSSMALARLSIGDPQPTTSPPPTGPDTMPPSVSFVSPTNGSTVPKNTTIRIEIRATDNVGVTLLTLFANGKRICNPTISTPWCTWRTPKGNKPIPLEIVGLDAAGNEGRQKILVYPSP